MSFLYYLGAATATYLAVQATSHVYTYFLCPSTLERYRIPGKYALVTGSSDGIGRALAEELCKRGFNVILHGRNEEKLQGIQKELQKYGTKVKYLVLDATKALSEVELSDVNVLINNVGGVVRHLVHGRVYSKVADTAAEDLDNIINFNARFAIQLTRLFLLQRTGPSFIMNVSSVTAKGMPYLVSYSSSKGFVESMTRALKKEMVLEGEDVDVMCLVVGNVHSGGNKMPTGLFTPSSAMLAASALRRVGSGTVLYGYWWHWLQVKPMDLMPEWMERKVINDTLSGLRDAELKSS